jgi:hypothetical protein
MELAELIGLLGATLVSGSEEDLPSIETVFVGSEFAELIAQDLFNVLLVTNQESFETIRVCAETDVVAICYANGQRPKAPEVKKAQEMGIPLLSTALTQTAALALLRDKAGDLLIKTDR